MMMKRNLLVPTTNTRRTFSDAPWLPRHDDDDERRDERRGGGRRAAIRPDTNKKRMMTKAKRL